MASNNKTQSKNVYIELLRFLFCVVIFIHHSATLLEEGQSPLLPNGAIAVEFFFIVSGYLAMLHVSRLKEKPANPMCYSMTYSLKKLLRVFPYAAFGTVLLYIFYMGVGNGDLTAYDRIVSLKNLPFELSGLTLTGIIPVTMLDIRNTPLWFLSALFIALPIVMYLAIRFEDVFKGYLVWIIPPVLFAHLSYKWGTLFCWGSYDGTIYGGIVRAIADLMLGFAAFYAAKWAAEKIKVNVVVKILLTCAELVLLAITLIFTRTEHYASDQILVTYCILLMVVLSFSGITYTSDLGRLPFSKIFTYLGTIAMPIYCVHWAVYVYMNKWTQSLSYVAGLLIDFGIALLISVVLSLVIKMIEKKVKRA